QQRCVHLCTGLHDNHPHPDPAGAVCSYAGYCPQYKFRLGRTYGTLTSQLLTCPEVAHSPHLVLQPTQGPCDDAQPPEQQEKLLEVPRAGWRAGVLPVSCSMIPGYTGFIPRAQHFFAKTYLEICKEARSDFARQQRRAWGGQERPREPAAGIPDSDHHLLPTVTGRAPLLAAAAPHVSPYSMADDDPHKYFISGETQGDGALSPLRRGRETGRDGGQLLLRLPFGTAHGSFLWSPGYKFQVGRTYGHLTHDALHLGLPGKQRPE
uniref:Ciliary microtubule inner protein 2B n=1 Tax=Crocodylus porosus TaxID=8502 RepID=A0A7M4G195_CROPO